MNCSPRVDSLGKRFHRARSLLDRNRERLPMLKASRVPFLAGITREARPTPSIARATLVCSMSAHTVASERP